MQYFISKLVVFLLDPSHWVLVSVALWFIIRRSVFRKRLVWTTLVVLCLLTNGWLYKSVMRWWQVPPQQVSQSFETGILLAGISGESYHGVGVFGPAADRFIQTVKLYHSKSIKRILITGGDGSLLQRGFKEATFLKAEMVASGVPDSAIVVEPNSRNTYENAMYSKRLLDSLGWKGPYILISSAIHLPRAKGLFEKQGMEVVLYPSNYEKVGKYTDWTDYCIPDFGLLSKWNLLFKEMVGSKFNTWSGKST